MNINIYANSLKRYYTRAHKMYVYLDAKDNKINEIQPEFGNDLHAATIREIEDRGLVGRVIADYQKAFTPFIGSTFGGETMRGKRRTLLKVYREAVTVREEGGAPYIMPHYKFNKWIQKDSIKILK